MPFTFSRLEIPDVILVEPRVFPDPRGFFMETFKHSDFAANGIPGDFVQGNYSRSSRGVFRGLHYQKLPHPMGKLVGVIRGEIWDVAVDIRKGSPTYGRWLGVNLSSQNAKRLWVPAGFAHGFVALSDEVDVVYDTTGEFAPSADTGIAYNDPDLGIPWPLKDLIISDKDKSLPRLKDADNNFVYQKK